MMKSVASWELWSCGGEENKNQARPSLLSCPPIYHDPISHIYIFISPVRTPLDPDKCWPCVCVNMRNMRIENVDPQKPHDKAKKNSERPNICYIFEKQMVQGYQILD